MQSEAAIAIVGMGGVFPGSPQPADLWAHVLSATDTCRDVPAGRWLLDVADAYQPDGPCVDRVYCRRGCFIEDFVFEPAGLELPRNVLAGLDVLIELTLHAGRQASCAARTDRLDRRRVSVILGNIAPSDCQGLCPGPGVSRSQLLREIARRRFGPCRGRGALESRRGRVPAGLLARGLGLDGGAYTLDAACASSLYALKLAMDELRKGRANAVLAGGVSRPDCLYTQMGFSQLRAVSPSGRCAPFDARADGLIVGEGVGISSQTSARWACATATKISAPLVAAGLSNDRKGNLLPPNSEGQLRAMPPPRNR